MAELAAVLADGLYIGGGLVFLIVIVLLIVFLTRN